MKKICIRVDGNEIIATGHVMRCLSVAERIRKHSVETVFVVADNRPCPMIEDRGFSAFVLGSQWDNLDSEAEAFCDYIKSNDINTVLIDSYFVTENYLAKVSQVANICYLDDLDKFVYPVHTVINYGLRCYRNYEERYRKKKLKTKFLLGGKYVPLREEFSFVKYEVEETVSRVLITTGGTDQLNMTARLLRRFMENELLSKLEYHTIVGRFNNNKEELDELKQAYSNIVIHENVSDMSRWMRMCDVAITAAGTTTFELMACGVPSICFQVADNQEDAYLWEEHGYMLYAGNAYKNSSECLNKCEECLLMLGDYHMRQNLSSRMQKFIDGSGAERIAQYLINISIC